MRMIDCFYEALFQTMEIAEALGNNETFEYEDVRAKIDRAIVNGATGLSEGGYSEDQYQLALFAVIAFIDETILVSPWEHKDLWKKELLQTKYFDTFNAGTVFFEKLNNLSAFDPAEKDIREVYYYCLSLGFCGKYYGSENKDLLDKMKNDNLTFLKGVEERATILEKQKKYFPDAYIQGKKGTGVQIHIDYRPFAYGIPVTILLILFYLLKLDIYEVANYLVTTI